MPAHVLVGDQKVRVTFVAGGVRHRLDGAKLVERGIDVGRARLIMLGHKRVARIKGRMAQLDPRMDAQSIENLAHKLEAHEFEIQDAWGDVRDRSAHRWFEVPHCTCGALNGASEEVCDPRAPRVYDRHCPVHGNNLF